MTDYRLKRLFNAKSGRCFDVATDHGFFNQHGFLGSIENAKQAIETVVDAGPDAVQLTIGSKNSAIRVRHWGFPCAADTRSVRKPLQP